MIKPSHLAVPPTNSASQFLMELILFIHLINKGVC